MSLNSLITVLISLLFFKVSYAMDLKEYRWKSRPLVITQDSQGLWVKQQKALDQDELNALIDSMPMRQSEMRR